MRPAHLPDFKSPPINEVVLGVQFNHPDGYQQILAHEVWTLFRSEYPQVEEKPFLPPAFETFGRQVGQIGFQILTGATHNRFWFLSPQKDELIQFQADRLLHNWRKIKDGSKPYPRYERIIAKFRSELEALETFFNSLSPQGLKINQCEMTYINQIAIGDDVEPEKWLRFLNFWNSYQPDDFSVTMRSIVRGSDGKPQGRLIVEAASGVIPDGSQIIQLNLTVRGTPSGVDPANAIEFLNSGRERIVSKFAEITTDFAHKKWERMQ